MDRKWIVRIIALLTAGLGGLTFPDDCRACSLFNCFKPTQTPAATYYPPTTTYSPTTSAGCGGNCGAAQCEQTVLRYVPQVAYRTVWQPVPVTTYRRTVSNNPATGLPITCTQPCTTYTYQARRVPYTTFRPVYATEPVSAPAAVPTTVTPGTVVPTTVAPSPGCGCNSASTGWSTAVSAQPYYAAPAPTTQPSYAAPGYSAPGYSAPTNPAPTYSVPGYSPPAATGSNAAAEATPWEPVQSTPGTSSGGYEPGSNFGSGTSDPASERPRIPPTIDPNLNNSSSSWQGTTERASSEPAGASPTSRGYPSTPSTAYDGQAQITPWNTVRPEVATPPSFPSSDANSSGSSSSVGSGWSTNSPAPAPYTVRPLPKVDAPAQHHQFRYRCSAAAQ